jgi:hypothetical protein
MNKFSEILNETNNFDEMEGHIVPISNILGKPNVATMKFGEKEGYIFKWNLPFNIEQYNGSKEIGDILSLFDHIQSISSTINKVQGYDIDFKIDSGLFVRFTPSSEDIGEGYKFIVGQNWRNLIIDYAQVAKFFKDRRFSIRNTKINDNELNETSDIKITTDADNIATGQFESLFNAEVDLLYNQEESINKSLNCEVNGGNIYIYPEEKKTYVIFNQDI